MSTDKFDDILPVLKQKLLFQLDEDSSNSICEFISNNELTQFLLLLIKNKNCFLLQFLWTVFKEFDKVRNIINTSIIHMLLSSLDNDITFFEISNWYKEFGCDYKLLTTNIITVIYLKGINYPEIKPFITDKLDDIKRMMVRSYWYDAVDTLCEIQNFVKLSFFSVGWYLLSVPAFNHIILKYNMNIYENKSFSTNFANYICISNRWEYIPFIITKLTDNMWKRIQLYFYSGYLTHKFITVLFHQLKKHNIKITMLKSSTLQFNSNSCYIQFLKDNNYYNIFYTKNKTIEQIQHLTDEILDASIVSVSTMMVIFEENNLNALCEIGFDCSLNLSNRYNSELKYIDSLLENDDLGWDKKMIDTYSNFKKYMNYLINQLNIGYELVTKFNSYLPLEQLEFNIPYRLRIINNLINIYNKLKINKFKEEYYKIYENCITIKVNFMNNLNNLIEYYIKNQNEKDPIIVDFIDLIENSNNYSFSKFNENNIVLNLLKHNYQIQSKVKIMLDYFQLPIQDILPILQKYTLITENFIL